MELIYNCFHEKNREIKLWNLLKSLFNDQEMLTRVMQFSFVWFELGDFTKLSPKFNYENRYLIEIQEIAITKDKFTLRINQKCANLVVFGGQTFAKFCIPNFAKLILQAQISLSRNLRKFCNTSANRILDGWKTFFCFKQTNWLQNCKFESTNVQILGWKSPLYWNLILWNVGEALPRSITNRAAHFLRFSFFA